MAVRKLKANLLAEIEEIMNAVYYNSNCFLSALISSESQSCGEYYKKVESARLFLCALFEDIGNDFGSSSCKMDVIGGQRDHLPLLFATAKCFSIQGALELETVLSKIMTQSGSFNKNTFCSIADFKRNNLFDDNAEEMFIYRLKVFLKYLRSIGNAFNCVVDRVNAVFERAKIAKSTFLFVKSEDKKNFNLPPNYDLETFLKTFDSNRAVDSILLDEVGYNAIMICFEYYMAQLITSKDFFNNREKLERFFLLFSNYLIFYLSNNMDIFSFCFNDTVPDSINTSVFDIKKIISHQSEIMYFDDVSSTFLLPLSPPSHVVTVLEPRLMPTEYFFNRAVLVIKNYIFERINNIRKGCKVTVPKTTAYSENSEDTGKTAALMKECSIEVLEECTNAQKRANQFGKVIELFSRPCNKIERKGKIKDTRLLFYDKKIISVNLDFIIADTEKLFTEAESLLSYNDVSTIYNELCEAIDCCLGADNEDDIRLYAAFAIESLKKLREAVLPKVVGHFVDVHRKKSNKFTSKIKKKQVIEFKRTGN